MVIWFIWNKQRPEIHTHLGSYHDQHKSKTQFCKLKELISHINSFDILCTHTHTRTPLHLSICFPHAMFSPTNEPTSAERPLVSYHWGAAKCQRRMRRKRERQTICPSNGEEGRRKTEKRWLGWRKLNTEDPKVDLPNVTASGVYRGRPSSWVSYEFFQ